MLFSIIQVFFITIIVCSSVRCLSSTQAAEVGRLRVQDLSKLHNKTFKKKEEEKKKEVGGGRKEARRKEWRRTIGIIINCVCFVQ